MNRVRRVKTLSAVLLGALLVLSAAGESWARGRRHRRRMIVEFPEGMSAAEKRQAISDLGAVIVYDIVGADAVVIEFPAQGAQPDSGKVRSAPRVMDVEDDFYANWLKMDEAPLPSLESVMTALPKLAAPPAADAAAPDSGEAPWGVLKVNAPALWNRKDGRTQGEGVTVAVIDTGVACDHPDLNCDLKEGYNALDPEALPMDDNMHGTHVAGTISARWDGKGVVGVAPLAHIIPVKVLDKTGGGDVSSIINGIVWAADHGVDVINMSLGTHEPSRALQRAVAYAVRKGVVIVAAAGNEGPKDGSVGFPGAYDGVIAVSAAAEDGTIAPFSSRGPEVTFIAPGVGVNSTIPGGGYKKLSGTSMASPHVAGLAALAISMGASGPRQVYAALSGAASPLCAAGSCLGANEQGGGLIDAAKLAR